MHYSVLDKSINSVNENVSLWFRTEKDRRITIVRLLYEGDSLLLEQLAGSVHVGHRNSDVSKTTGVRITIVGRLSVVILRAPVTRERKEEGEREEKEDSRLVRGLEMLPKL